MFNSLYAVYFSKLGFVGVLFVCVFGFSHLFYFEGFFSLQHGVFSEFLNQYGQTPKANS